MATGGSAIHARIIACVLTVAVLGSGCAYRAFVFPNQDVDSAQLARDQTECTAEAKEMTGYTDAVSKGLGTTLTHSVVGAAVGGLVGGMVGVGASAGQQTGDPGTVGLIIGGGIAAGVVVGWFVGTGLGVRAASRQAQDRVDDAFQRCMENRGYKIGRDRS